MFAGNTLLAHTDWLPAIGLNIGWRLDGLALMFGLLTTGVGLLIILYAAYYLGASDPAGQFYSLLMLFMAAMLGIVLSDNLLLLVFWELTSVSSFLLVGYWAAAPQAGAAARRRVPAPAWRWRSPAAAGWRCWPACCCWARSPAVLS